MLTKHQLTGFLLRSMRASLFLALLGFFCLLAIAASRDEESSKEKETDRSLKPVKVAHGKAETVKTWSARSADRKSSRTKEGKKKGALKKKKRTFGRKTSERAGTRKQKLAKNPNLKKRYRKTDSKENVKRGRKGEKKGGRRQARKKKQARRRKLRKGRKLEKKGKKEKCPSTSTRTVPGRAIDGTCLVNILTIVETYFKQVANFEKQWKRIVSKNKTSVSKGGKMDAFKKPLKRLVEAGGGDEKNLSCQGSTSSPGALQMQNLSSILTNCSDQIKEACHESQKPTINMTEVDKCNAMIAEFEMSVAGSDGCLKKTGEDLCDCFSNQTLLDQAAVLRKCSLANESKTMATALKTCKSSYGDCRKYKEDIIDIVSACSKPLDKQKEKAKALAENVDNMKAAQGAVASVTGSGRFFTDRSSLV